MNKKAQTLSVGMVMAVFIAIVLIIFLVGGGASTALDITKFLKSIPTPFFIFFGIVIIFKLLRRKK